MPKLFRNNSYINMQRYNRIIIATNFFHFFCFLSYILAIGVAIFASILFPLPHTIAPILGALDAGP